MLYYLQKFEAYDSKGSVVAGDKNKEVIAFALNFDEGLLFFILNADLLCISGSCP